LICIHTYKTRCWSHQSEEQKQIVSHIKSETATIDTAIAKAEREIELIREYKEAMIAEAVMGKRK
jgi:type I restriction enzyme S subunit